MHVYVCPECKTQYQLRQRAVIEKRKCPACNTPISPEEVDRQDAELARQKNEARLRSAMIDQMNDKWRGFSTLQIVLIITGSLVLLAVVLVLLTPK